MARTPGSFRWARFTKELVWATFNGTGSTPAGGAVIVWVPLEEDGLVLDADPKRWTIRTADGYNIKTDRGTHRYGVTGTMRHAGWPAVVDQFIPSAWTTSGSGASRALDSWTVDYQKGFEVVRTLGVRFSKQTVQSSDSDTDPLMRVESELIGKSQVRDGSITLAAPALTVYPYGSGSYVRPYTHRDVVTTLFGSGRTGIAMLRAEVTNILYVRFFESATIDRANWNGRDVAIGINYADPTSVDRDRFEAQTAGALSVGWSNTAATKSVTVNGQGKVYYGADRESAKFGDDMMFDVSFEPFRDPATGADCAVTIV